MHEKHPTEYFTHEMRQQSNIFAQLKPHELVLMNLPLNITEESIRNLCQSKDIYINNITTYSALDNKKLAYVVFELGSPKQVQILKEMLKNKWIEDK